ncbi:MAG: hypothetical protein BGO07_04360 [Alphaproteobacteria bacterium 40-19]|nr:MAG: hypothetical protein BGO07_04360 [Alphaproteobacteria bacterium 40-19]
MLKSYEEENILDEILPQFFNQENSQNIIAVSKNLIDQKSIMYKEMYFHLFDFGKYNKNGKIDVDFFLKDYKNRRWLLHHYRDQTRLQAAMKTAD